MTLTGCKLLECCLLKRNRMPKSRFILSFVALVCWGGAMTLVWFQYGEHTTTRPAETKRLSVLAIRERKKNSRADIDKTESVEEAVLGRERHSGIDVAESVEAGPENKRHSGIGVLESWTTLSDVLAEDSVNLNDNNGGETAAVTETSQRRSIIPSNTLPPDFRSKNSTKRGRFKHSDNNERDLGSFRPTRFLNVNFTSSQNPRWLPIDTTEHGGSELSVYAAYYDDVDSVPLVRVLASAYQLPSNVHVRCVWFHSEDLESSVGFTEGHLVLYHDKNKKFPLYAGGFVKCPLVERHSQPYAVSVVISFPTDLDDDNSVVNDDSRDVTSVLQVHYSGVEEGEGGNGDGDGDGLATAATDSKPDVADQKWNITKCYPALHGGYNDAVRLVQQVEISGALGVDHFIFYNLSVGPDVNAALSLYQQMGVADILDWSLDATASKSRYFGQHEAIQDCLYRTMHSSRYVLFGDLDEMHVPRSGESTVELLDRLFRENPRCGAFLFLNVFYENKPDSGPARFHQSALADRYRLNMLTTRHRVDEIWLKGRRAKPAVMPGRIEVGEIHTVARLRGDYEVCKMDPSLGLLQHYREGVPIHVFHGHSGAAQGYVLDPYLLNYADQIVARVGGVLGRLNAVNESLKLK